MQNTHQIENMCELTVQELDEVSGGLGPLVVGLAIGAGIYYIWGAVA